MYLKLNYTNMNEDEVKYLNISLSFILYKNKINK